MRDIETRFGYQLAQAVANRLDAHHAVVQVEGLALAIDLAQDGLTHGGLVVADRAGLDGEPFEGRGL